MPFIKFVHEKYPTKTDMINLLGYIAGRFEFVSGLGISTDCIESVFCEFEYVKRYWNKAEEGRRQAVHMIVSFENTKLSLDSICEIAWKIASIFGNNFQVLYGIHMDTFHPHIHFAINTIGYMDGRMFTADSNYGYLLHLREEIEAMENCYGRAKK